MGNENQNNENVNTGTQGNEEQGKTFTQEQVNAIVSDRLARDRQKQGEELSKREQELNNREFRLNSRQKLIDRGYPENIMDALNCSSTEAFDKALDIIDGLIKEHTPSAEQEELEKNRARFTTSMSGNHTSVMHDDPIKKAMNLR